MTQHPAPDPAARRTTTIPGAVTDPDAPLPATPAAKSPVPAAAPPPAAETPVPAAAAPPPPAPSAAVTAPDAPPPPADGQRALAAEILHLLAPLTQAAANPMRLARLLARIGWNPAAAGDKDSAEVTAWLESVAGALGDLEELVARPPQDLDGLRRALATIGGVIRLVRQAPPALGAFDPSAFAEDVVHDLVTDWLVRHHQVLFHVLVLLGVLVLPADAGQQSAILNEDGEPVRTGAARARLRPRRLAELLRDPVGTLRADYLPRGLADDRAADELAAKLLPRLGALLNSLGATVLMGLGETEGTGLDEASVALGRRMLTLAVPIPTAPGVIDALGLTLGISSPEAGGLGAVLVPRGRATVDQLLGDGWALRGELSGAGPAVALGPHGVTFTADTPGRVRLFLELRKDLGTDTPALLLGSASGTRLEIGAFRAWTKAELETGGAQDTGDVEIGVAADRAAVVIAGGDGDGFLATVLPADGLRIEFALGLQWSRRKGLAFTGSAGLDTTLPVNARLGPFELLAVHLKLSAGTDQRIEADVTATARLDLGPVLATVERLGLDAGLTTEDGNLGPVGLGAGFAPPKGAALAVGAGPVTGGGYLFFDQDKEEYAGVLALQLESVSLKAVGLLTTRMPDGADGFSLLILISAEFTPVQLGFGFTLNGVGGLIGINRSVSVDTLRAGIRSRALDSLLFPRDPLARAPEIVATLGAVFPPTPGRHVVGPMARIGWGTPTLLTIDLGLLLELPTPVRLMLLGRLRMALPTEASAVVAIHMDVLGVIDFERGEASVDATLYDSHLAAFALTGDMALRARWKGKATFALSAGGFHPRFQPPEGFPALRRLSLSLLSGDNPRLRLESYFALTSNTVQFGARLELYAAALGFSVDGQLAFDALVQFEPFGFQVDITGRLALKRGSRTLMGVGVAVALSGPTPWHVRGKARFEILFFTAEISFDRTFGSRAAPTALAEPVDVADGVEKALADPRNWTAQLTGAGRTVVTLRELPSTEGQLIVHPLGGLAFTQRFAPLGITMDRFGNAPIKGPRRLDLDPELTVTDPAGGTPRTVRLAPTREYFAPAQFLDLSDDEKIAAPSFESLIAGATADGALARARERTGVFASPIRYEEVFEDGAHRGTAPAAAPVGRAGLRVAAAPAARAATRRTGPGRFAAAPRGLGLRDTGWVVSDGTAGWGTDIGGTVGARPRDTGWVVSDGTAGKGTDIGGTAGAGTAGGGTDTGGTVSAGTVSGPTSGERLPSRAAATGTTWTEAAELRRASTAPGPRITTDTRTGGPR
ncbi:DUF6603 domain-containing protein [Streptomyces sp. NPDC048290]|uniref:DUF6603 domain-containing protein n=1 Tax=Streptomyces sp. NPDC048290 TaxID=3155811 RepID=UPI00343EB06E